MKKAPPEKQQRHDALVKDLWNKYKQIEDTLRKTMPFEEVLRAAAHKEAALAWRHAWNTCPDCGSTNTTVENHDLNWHDGDVTCTDCGTYVRMYDAG